MPIHDTITDNGNVVVNVWADDMDEATAEQVKNVTEFDFVPYPVALMADTHLGYGVPIGTVLPTKGAIIPSAIGVDIGCLDMDTEFLSPEGWVKISKWSGQEVLSYDPKSETASFKAPLNYIVLNCESFYHFKNSKGLDQMLSEEHRIPVWAGYKGRGYDFSVMIPSELASKDLSHGYYGFKAAFKSDNIGVSLSDDMIRVEVMVQADGRVRQNGLGNHVELHFRKQRKIDRALKLLSNAGIEYSETTWGDGSTCISFQAGNACDKDLTKFWPADARQLAVIAEESLQWDGHEGYRSYYSSTSVENADLIQYAFAGSGVRAGIARTKDVRNSSWSTLNTVTPTKNDIVGFSAPKIVPSVDGKKYCFTTPTGFFIARRNGHIFATGNCGMSAVETVLTSNDLTDDLSTLHDAITVAVPAGMGQGHDNVTGGSKRDRRWHKFTNSVASPTMSLAQSNTAYKQFGSLGGGNHFVEICLDERDVVWIVLHSGSRGIGNQLATEHINIAKGLTKEKLTDPNLAYLKESTPEFDAYIKAMLWAQAYAMENRQAMMDNVLAAFCSDLGFLNNVERSRINCHHNFTEKESHFGDSVWLTRKGAVKADVGDRGIIPGSMGTETYIVTGLGNPDSYNSSSHGAGRKMSRSKARKSLDLQGLRDQMAGQVWNEDAASQLIDEDPRAYKDVGVVMANQSDLVKIDHTLKSVLNYKGVK